MTTKHSSIRQGNSLTRAFLIIFPLLSSPHCSPITNSVGVILPSLNLYDDAKDRELELAPLPGTGPGTDSVVAGRQCFPRTWTTISVTYWRKIEGKESEAEMTSSGYVISSFDTEKELRADVYLRTRRKCIVDYKRGLVYEMELRNSDASAGIVNCVGRRFDRTRDPKPFPACLPGEDSSLRYVGRLSPPDNNIYATIDVWNHVDITSGLNYTIKTNNKKNSCIPLKEETENMLTGVVCVTEYGTTTSEIVQTGIFGVPADCQILGAELNTERKASDKNRRAGGDGSSNAKSPTDLASLMKLWQAVGYIQ